MLGPVVDQLAATLSEHRTQRLKIERELSTVRSELENKLQRVRDAQQTMVERVFKDHGYVCSRCGRSFGALQSLYQHMRDYHDRRHRVRE